MALVSVGIALVLCLLPSVLFLGFWHGLVRMQHRSLLTRVSERADCTDPTVTWSNVADAYADPQKSLFASSSESQSATLRDDQCPACATENDTFASFCHDCFRKLD